VRKDLDLEFNPDNVREFIILNCLKRIDTFNKLQETRLISYNMDVLFVIESTNLKKNKNLEDYFEFLDTRLAIIKITKEDLSHFFLEFFNFEQKDIP